MICERREVNGAPLRERVLAIVNLIAQYVLGAEDASVSEQELVAELMSVGYKMEEIDDAFSWMEAIALRPATPQEEADVMLNPTTYRFFTPQEEQLLSRDARGFLVRIKAMGLLNNDTEEEIIDRALRNAEEQVSEQEIKLITIMTLLSRSNSLWQREVDCFLDNDWARIYH
jgi:Smg protein